MTAVVAAGAGVTGRASAVAAGLAADRVLGEPPASIHPVAVFGSAMQHVERVLYADRRSAGALYACAGILAAAGVGRLMPRRKDPAAWAALSTATYVAVAGRALVEAAAAVQIPLAEGDVASARTFLPALVGRDPSGLDATEISRAVVESVAENTVDAVVAPAFWAAVAGAPAVLAYRAVNTLDAMVGHRSDRYLRFGWAAARADDVAGWLPARLTAVLVAAVRPGAVGPVWRAVRVQAAAHPSPNAGVAEAAFAACLGLRLGGVNVYDDRSERRPDLGEGRPASVEDITRANKLSRDVVALLGALLIVPVLLRPLREGSKRVRALFSRSESGWS